VGGVAASCANNYVCVCVTVARRLRHDVVENLCRKVVANARFGRRVEHTVPWIHFSILCAAMGVQYVTFIQNMEAKQNLSISVFCIQCGLQNAHACLMELLRKNGGHIKHIVY